MRNPYHPTHIGGYLEINIGALSDGRSRWRHLLRWTFGRTGRSGRGFLGDLEGTYRGFIGDVVGITLWNSNMAMEHHLFEWENPLCLWQFSIAMFNYKRVRLFFSDQEKHHDRLFDV